MDRRAVPRRSSRRPGKSPRVSHCCDGSVFPTSAGWNLSLTVVAVALRTAHRIARA
jgi:hypothetical protein